MIAKGGRRDAQIIISMAPPPRPNAAETTEVKKLAKQGIAVLVTDHNVQQTLRICDRAYILHSGKNLRDGDPRSIINDPIVKEAYLASTFRGDEFD